MNKKILVFGANGMLGAYLSKHFTEKGYEVVKTDMFDNEDNNIVGKDITNEKELKVFVYEQNPDFVINCAAYTNVDEAEVFNTLYLIKTSFRFATSPFDDISIKNI